MAGGKKRRPIPAGPLTTRDGTITPVWAQYFMQFRKMAETQDDADEAENNPPTQAEFNALVGVVNDLIDKLQAVGLME